MAPQIRLRACDADLPPTHWRKRVRCCTFQLYTIVMGTGGLDFLLYQINVAYGGHWLVTLADIVYIYNIILFVTITMLIATRFVLYPPSMKNVFLHSQESSFVPCLPLALATLIASAAALGVRDTGFWFAKTTLILWWIYVTLALTTSFSTPLLQWTVQKHPLAEFTPLWLLPPLGVTFSGAVCYEVIQNLPDYEALYTLLVAYVLTGMGMTICLLYSSLWISRLMAHGAPPPKAAPVFCIAIGPIAWGSYGFAALGDEASRVFPATRFLGSQSAGEIFSVASVCISLILWGLSWFLTATSLLYFLVSVFKRDVALSTGALNNFGLTFPLAGHVAVAFILGTRFDSRFLTDLGIVQTCIWFILWAFATLTTAWGIWNGEVCAEGKDCNVPAFAFEGDYEKVDDGTEDEKSDERSPSRDRKSARSESHFATDDRV